MSAAIHCEADEPPSRTAPGRARDLEGEFGRDPLRDLGYSLDEEAVHAALHGLGAVAALGGLGLLVWLAAVELGDPAAALAAVVYGGSLVICFAASAFCHSLPEGPAKRLFELVDYCAIYLLIAGTYTPFALLALPADVGLPLLAGVWALALLGMGVEVVGRARPAGRLLWLSVPLYLGIGWLGPLVAGEQLLTALSPAAFWLLLSGGLVYTGGVVFFLWRSLPYNHAVWHALVLVASAIHFGAVVAIVLPATPAV